MAELNHCKKSVDAGGRVLEVVPPRLFQASLFLAWQFSLLVALLIESNRLRDRLLQDGTPGDWWEQPAWDGTLLLPLLFLAPLCWCWRFGDGERNVSLPVAWDIFVLERRLRAWSSRRSFRVTAGMVIASLSVWMSCWAVQCPVSREFPLSRVCDALPLVQDEFSYLLQAQGIIEGRWFWDGPQNAPELFHQMHVLNEGRFASRYPPGTGLWIAPWLAAGHPDWGMRLAAAIVAVGMFLIGCELQGTFAGIVAGGLIAMAPSLLIFSNLFLSHLPTLVGVTGFLLAFLHMIRTGKATWAFLSGCGLTLAMLSRPLTAAAIALPFGIWFLASWRGSMREKHSCEAVTLSCPNWSRPAVALGAPLLIGLGGILWQNEVLTGNPLLMPWQLYTQLYTPRHSYGFGNGQAIASTSTRILHLYNDWAQDLDLQLAFFNLWNRLKGSFAWSLGIVPLTMTAVLLVGTFVWQSVPLRLLASAIVSLHLAYFPYWLDGILNHHYVFESGPIWLLIFAVLSSQLLQTARHQRRWLFPVWWAGLVAVSLWGNVVPAGTHGRCRLQSGWNEFLSASQPYRTFEQVLKAAELKTPALILIRESERDLHVQYVRNRPPFEGPVLVAIERPELYSIRELSELFPDRTLYRYDSREQTLTRLPSISFSQEGADDF